MPMAVALGAIAVIAVVMLIMSGGVMFNGRCLRGSCGGSDRVGPDGESLLCATCPKRHERKGAADRARDEDLVNIA